MAATIKQISTRLNVTVKTLTRVVRMWYL